MKHSIENHIINVMSVKGNFQLTVTAIVAGVPTLPSSLKQLKTLLHNLTQPNLDP